MDRFGLTYNSSLRSLHMFDNRSLRKQERRRFTRAYSQRTFCLLELMMTSEPENWHFE